MENTPINFSIFFMKVLENVFLRNTVEKYETKLTVTSSLELKEEKVPRIFFPSLCYYSHLIINAFILNINARYKQFSFKKSLSVTKK